LPVKHGMQTLVRRYTDDKGVARVTGKVDDLKQSQAYPAKFGRAVAAQHAKNIRDKDR
jgi:hypothetical protein